MKICVLGSGYVGLVSSACFAEFGHRVVNIDINQAKIEALKEGVLPIYEPGLKDLVCKGLKSKRLGFSSNLEHSIKDSSIVMIAVGTPSLEEGILGACDLSFVLEAAREIALNLETYTLIVTKSTVPVGTSDRIGDIMMQTRPNLRRGHDFDIASNPEFLREGSAIHDFMSPDRIIVGTDSCEAEKLLRHLYRPLYLNETPMIFTDIASSEMIKYASNAFLATKISFINQIADLCEEVGADVGHVAKGMGLDKRIGRTFLNAGPGYGGSCFPKDTAALSVTARSKGVSLSIIDTVMAFNEQRKKQMAVRILEVLKKRSVPFESATIAVLGITFKPNTDDLREAPSLVIIEELLKHSIHIRIYDPLYCRYSVHLEHVPKSFEKVEWCESSYEAVEGSHLCVILTEWNEFRALDLNQVASSLRLDPPVLMDFRNIYPLEDVTSFNYMSLGRCILRG